MEETKTAEEEFTEEFYKLYHETRLMLIKEFTKDESDKESKKRAIHWAQIFLNRLIFIFFVEDHNFIPNRIFTDRLIKILQSPSLDEQSHVIFDNIDDLFKRMNTGSKVLGINEFNGGLFAEDIPIEMNFPDLREENFFINEKQDSKLSKKSLAVDLHISISSLYVDTVNPIIKNFLIMDSYDFTSDANVTILGHIFEQSISDLERLYEEDTSTRKKFGVFYTPDSITEYICKNTIIPYLSKNNSDNVEDLVKEYEKELEELETRIKNLKILDPSCGSGAFLVKAVDILLQIDEEIQKYKSTSVIEQKGLEEYTKTRDINYFIENNIYGVDISEESVEITKLSLFLRLAGPDRKLSYLGNNIKVGNSLVNDKDTDPLGFNWKEEYPFVFIDSKLRKHESEFRLGEKIEDGFDIILGNPPWQILKSDVDEFFSPIFSREFSDKKFSQITKIKKNEFMKKCLSDEKINNAWNSYLDSYKKQMSYFLESDEFKHQISEIDGKKSSGIDINLYKLFVEKSFHLLKDKGVFGMVLPAGIYSDLGTKSLRQLIFEKCQILELCGFINSKPIFQDVHRQFKFCTLLFKKGQNTKEFLAKFRITDDNELKNFKNTAFTYNLELIKIGSPDSLTIIECKNQTDQKILQKIFKMPIIKNHEWKFKASREFHMTDDSDLFHTGNIGPPLYEGKMIDMFEDNFSNPRYWIDQEEGESRLIMKELNRIKKAKGHKIMPKIHSDEYRLVWRTITNSIDKRTLISTILPPKIFLGNSLNYLNPIIFDGEKYIRPISYEETVYLCGIFNSFVIDFVLRHRIVINLNIFQIMQLPVPRFDKNNTLHQKILKNSAMLICKNDKYFELREKIGISEYATDPTNRLALEAQINACVAKIYELDLKEFKFILDIFTIEDKVLKDLTLDEFNMLNP